MTTTAPMTCAAAAPLLPLVADGVLRAEDDQDLFNHLAGCDHCQETLARHDLIGLALTATTPPTRVVRHRWWPVLPLAAAALLAITLALWPSPAAVPTPTLVTNPAPPAPEAPQAPIIIEREVTALPLGAPGRRMILVRRGDQVLLVDPQAPEAPAHPDATPASMRY